MIEITVDEKACCSCSLCVDICPTDSLKYEFKGLSKRL